MTRQAGRRAILAALVVMVAWAAISGGVGGAVDFLIFIAILFGIPYMFQSAARRTGQQGRDGR